jgi:hypothetical protein
MLFFFADMVEEMLWGDNGGAFANTRVIIANQPGPERIPPKDTPEILHAFGERAGGYETGIIEYPPMALEPHVINTFGGVAPFPKPSDTYARAAEAAMVASIEKAIDASMPVFKNATHREVFEAGNPREYILEFHMQDGTIRRELNCPRHQMVGFGTNIQGTAEAEHADGTILLLQIDSDDRVHEKFIFCDAGAAQFWIKPADLVQGRFDSAWATTEGG